MKWFAFPPAVAASTSRYLLTLTKSDTEVFLISGELGAVVYGLQADSLVVTMSTSPNRTLEIFILEVSGGGKQ